MNKKSTIANQEQRREIFHRQIKRSKIVLPSLLVFFILLFGGTGFFILSNNSPQYLFLRISLATIIFLMTVLTIFFLLLCSIPVQQKETISFILLSAILGGPIIVGISYLLLFAALPANITVTNQRVLFLHLFFILFTVIWYIFIRKSWIPNLPINRPLLFRDKPYLRIFYRNLITDEKKRSRFECVTGGKDVGRIGPHAFCILFPEIVTEKAIKKRESLYENGGQKNGEKISNKEAIFESYSDYFRDHLYLLVSQFCVPLYHTVYFSIDYNSYFS